MEQWKRRMAAAWFVLGLLAWCAIVPSGASAQNPAVDPAAVQILKRMTDFLDGLQRFSVKTESVLEEQHASRLHVLGQLRLEQALRDLDADSGGPASDIDTLRSLARDAIQNLARRLTSIDHEPR